MFGLPLLGTLAVAAAGLLAVGCGSSDEPIPTRTADALITELDALKLEIGAEDCLAADDTLNQINSETSGLSGQVKEGMNELLDHLESLFAERCAEIVQPTTTTSSSTTTTSSSTTTEPTTTTETTTTTTEPTTTTTTEPTTTTTTPGGGTGGTAPGRKRGSG
jgi:hypothetical protein